MYRLVSVLALLVAWFGTVHECAQFNNDTKVYGVCSRPNLPPKAKIRNHNDRVKFSENENIFVSCEENQFPIHVQNKTCKHGQWTGKAFRCGKAVLSNIVHIQAHNCTNPRDVMLSLVANQSDEAPYPLPPNSFHFTRIDENAVISVTGSDCYKWKLKFDKKIEVAFLLIDINTVKSNGSKEDRPRMSVHVEHRLVG